MLILFTGYKKGSRVGCFLLMRTSEATQRRQYVATNLHSATWTSTPLQAQQPPSPSSSTCTSTTSICISSIGLDVGLEAASVFEAYIIGYGNVINLRQQRIIMLSAKYNKNKPGIVAVDVAFAVGHRPKPTTPAPAPASTSIFDLDSDCSTSTWWTLVKVKLEFKFWPRQFLHNASQRWWSPNDVDDDVDGARRRSSLVDPLSQSASQPHHHIANNAWICAIDLLNYCFDRGRYMRSTPLHSTRLSFSFSLSSSTSISISSSPSHGTMEKCIWVGDKFKASEAIHTQSHYTKRP